MIKWVLTYDGVPPVALFSGTEGQGTPLVVAREGEGWQIMEMKKTVTLS